MVKNSPGFNKVLVSTVKNYPCLYDPNLKEYTLRNVKNQCWKEIGEEMNSTADHCKATFRTLRCVFVENMKKYANDSPEVFLKRNYLTESMLFLKPFIKPRLPTNQHFKRSLPVKEESNLNLSNSSPKTSHLFRIKLQKNNDESFSSDQEYKEVEFVDNSNHDDVNDENSIDHDNLEEILDSEDMMDESYLNQNHSGVTVSKNFKREAVSYMNEDEQTIKLLRMDDSYRDEKTHTEHGIQKSNQHNNADKFLTNYENPKRQFLLSLLPDLDLMNGQQMRKFRSKVSSLIDEILVDETN